MRMRYLVGIPICLVLTFVVATRLRWPGSVGDSPPVLAQQRALWAAHKPSQYILTVNHDAGAEPTWFTLSRVSNGVVRNALCRRLEQDGTISECAATGDLFPLTVEQLFEAVEMAYRRKYQDVNVQYEAPHGYPETVHFDPRKDKTGDEWGYSIELRETTDDN